MQHKLLTALLLNASTACVPFVIPPVQAAGLWGATTGRVVEGATALDPRSPAAARIGVHPLQLLPKAQEHAFDVGLGYQLESTQGGETSSESGEQTRRTRGRVSGPYLEGSYYPLRLDLGSQVWLRAGVRAAGDLLLTAHNRTGAGGLLAAQVEIAGNTETLFSNTSSESNSGSSQTVVGYARGVWGLGVFAGGALREVGESRYGGFVAGMSVRIPFVAGLVCCVNPFVSSGSSASAPPRVLAKPRRKK